jgi:hypothetical protein
MPKNFNLPSISKPSVSSFKDVKVQLRVLLGLLLSANLIAAGLAFHLFDGSPEQLARQLQSKRQEILAQVMKLNYNRMIANLVATGRDEGAKFISRYMTSRRATYSTIISELNQLASTAGMKPKDAVIGLEAIQGTDSLDMMTVTYSFEGPYKSLVQFINLIDRSPRFMIIEGLSASPQSNGNLQITVKLNTFVKDDTSAS